MCYILYGAVDKSINPDDYENAIKNSPYRFNIGTKHDVKMCAVNDSYEFTVTGRCCDCDFPVGENNVEAAELKDLALLIDKLKSSRGAKCLYISKTWAGTRNKSEKTVNIAEIDVIPFLAHMEKSCLYRIDFT